MMMERYRVKPGRSGYRAAPGYRMTLRVLIASLESP